MALAWHRFALRLRDLFLDGEDTTWYDVGDENGAVSVEWDGPVRPEPVGGAVFARVVRSANDITVSVLDLSGSAEGSWSEPTGPGRCRSTIVRVLLDVPRSGRRPRLSSGGLASALQQCRLPSSATVKGQPPWSACRSTAGGRCSTFAEKRRRRPDSPRGL